MKKALYSFIKISMLFIGAGLSNLSVELLFVFMVFANTVVDILKVVFGEEPKDAYQELIEDLIEIAMSFAGKLYGMRSRKKKRLVEGFKKLLEEVEKGE